MKKLKIALIAAMLCLLIVGLYISQRGDGEYIKTEFVMDTTCSVTFYGKDAKEASTAVFDELRRIENLMSLYKDGSDVSRINKAKAGEKIKVSPDTYKVIKTAIEISKKSDGAFDITIAPVSMLWNFNGEEHKIPDKEDIETTLSYVGYKNIILVEDNTVIKKNSKTKIDLGGVAKGYGADCAKAVALKYDLTGGIIDLGGNIICFGENPKSDTDEWIIGIQIPFKPQGTYEKTVKARGEAIVTSGSYQRYFMSEGKLYHHIIDPKTGYPADREYGSVTILSESSLEADCLATAAYVLGKEKGTALAKEYGGKIYYEE